MGLATFRPVKVHNIEDHKMHTEWYSIDETTAAAIMKQRQAAKVLLRSETTTVRTLESAAQKGMIRPCSGQTDIFIYPPYEFQIVDKLITNFHLPKSTLLMLVSAFAGRENILRAYHSAIDEQYRFFSFGDAMFIFK